MEHDEHEMLIDYSEMTAFNFNSKEFREVAKDLAECRDMVSSFNRTVKNFTRKFKPARGY